MFGELGNKYKWVVLLFLLIILLLNLGVNSRKSLVWDEPIFILNGLYYLQEGRTFNAGQPILSGIVSAFPLLFLDVSVLPDDEVSHIFKDARKVWPYYKNNNITKITFWAHIIPILLSLLFGFYVYKWASELYGKKAGLFALFLYTFCVNILAWTTSVAGDFMTMGFLLLCSYYFWSYLKHGNKKDLFISGIILGLAISVKIIALVFIFILFLQYVLFNNKVNLVEIKKLLISFFILGIFTISTITLLHVFDAGPIYEIDDPLYQKGTGKQFRTEERLDSILDNYFEKDSWLNGIVKFLVTEVNIPGRTFYQAVYTHSQDSISGGRASYLIGEWKIDGWWYYYFLVMLFKVPIPILLFMLFSVLFFSKIRHSDLKNEVYLILPILVWFVFFSFVSRIDSGIRHLLIMFPFMFIFCSKIINLKINRVKQFLFCILSLWLIGAVIFTYPFYTSYFNEFVGIKNGYKYLSVDNIDSGQDMRHIKKYLEERKIENLKLAYNGIETPEYMNIKYENLTCQPTTGLIIVSVGVLQGSVYDAEYRSTGPDPKCFSWLYDKQPIDYIGYSIFVYNLTE